MGRFAGAIRLLIRNEFDGIVIFAVIGRLGPFGLAIGNPQITADGGDFLAAFIDHGLDRDVAVFRGGVVVAGLTLRIGLHLAGTNYAFVHFIFRIGIFVFILFLFFPGPGALDKLKLNTWRQTGRPS